METPIERVKLADLENLPAAQTELIIRKLNLKPEGAAGIFAGRMADHLEEEVESEVYKEALREAAEKLLDRIKLPRWLKFVKGIILGVIVDWLIENAGELLVNSLRNLARKL